MRVTNSMMIQSFLRNLNTNTTIMSTYQNQLSSGKRINRLSDDPIGIMSVLDNRAKLSKLAQHNSSIDNGSSWLAQSETSLREINGVISTLYEKTVYASNGTLSDSDRNAIGALVGQLKEHVVQLGNTTYGGRYIFGGYNTTQAPFSVDAGGNLLYNGIDLSDTSVPAATYEALKNQNIAFSTGTNLTTTVNVTGVDVMGTGDNNLYKILDELETALNNGTSGSSLSGFISKLQGKQDDILSLLADVGGRQNRLETMAQSNADNEINYTALLSKVEDIDQAYVTMQFKMAEAIYRASLSVGAQIIQPTLLDFIK